MRNHFYVLIYLLILSTFSCAQQNVIDSLLLQIKSGAADTNRVIYLCDLAWEYKNIGKYDTAIYYSETGYTLAEKIDYKTGVASAYNTLGVIYQIHGNYSEALNYFFKTLKIAEETGNKSRMQATLGNIGVVYKKKVTILNHWITITKP